MASALELDKLRDASRMVASGSRNLNSANANAQASIRSRSASTGRPAILSRSPHANLSRVPQEYIRRQTLTNAERYITPDLKEYETLILNSQDRVNKMENEFLSSCELISLSTPQSVFWRPPTRWRRSMSTRVSQTSRLDQNYCRPNSMRSDTIHIVAGRHPVVEIAQADTPFIPNDVELSNQDAQIGIITGPNMAGKSTYLRQVALITLWHRSAVTSPPISATIGIVDRIFTRIGAQDDLATGQSTFMVEMVETANILHHATPRSLIILDEIGRGTSTYDGLAIARSIVEYLHNNKRAALEPSSPHTITNWSRSHNSYHTYAVSMSRSPKKMVKSSSCAKSFPAVPIKAMASTSHN